MTEVGGFNLPLWKMMDESSVGMMIIYSQLFLESHHPAMFQSPTRWWSQDKNRAPWPFSPPPVPRKASAHLPAPGRRTIPWKPQRNMVISRVFPVKNGDFMDWSHEKSWIFQAKNVVKLIGVTKMNRHVGFHLSKRWKIGNQGETGNLAIQAYQWFWVESNPLHSTRVYGPGVVQNMGRSRYWSMSTLNMTWGLIYSSILSSKIQQAWVFSATQQGWRLKNRCQVHAQIQPSCWCLRCIASARKNGGWNHRVYHPGYGSYEIFFGIIFSKRQFWNVLNMEDENQKFLRPSQSHRTGLTGPLFFRVHLQSLQCTEIWGWAGSRFRFQNVLLWGLSSWGYELLHSLSDARFRPTFSISNNHLEN